ncbi:hypothetical protein VSDG_08885 [Cytospora chrysosperma]|uniref:LCCL domain-containing protein n=1 Tax=Cytospora chrysosperma TaxID=252740 RepID=A0A423VEA7_CYTCH|nr:hypothetical protein VSDG_08885 [Valsa sordida]
MAAQGTPDNVSMTYEDIALRGSIDEEAHMLPSHDFEEGEQVVYEREPKISGPPSKGKSWLRGPHPPRIQTIRPLFPDFQQAPTRLLQRTCPTTRSKRLLFFAFIVIWTLFFTVPLAISSIPTTDDTGRDVVNLDCIDTLWRWKNECGLDGIDCGPFSNDTLAFRCPAGCKDVKVLNPRFVGASEVIYRPLVIGGPHYRGDSFICASAIHAGLVSDTRGGCGRLDRIGESQTFPSSMAHGIESIEFDSYFPLAFTLTKDPGIQCGTGELRGVLLFISILFTSILCIFATSQWQYLTIFVAIFIHVGMVSDPPGASRYNTSTFPDHLSRLAGRLLPALFCAVIIYRTVVRRTVAHVEAHLEKTVLWLGGFWFGALSNLTFEWIPISRLTTHDLEQQPGAKLALGIIVIILAFIVAQQAYTFWLEGRLVRYLCLYAIFVIGILSCILTPGLEFRLHHYVLALLLLPGTSHQTRPSLLYQGILLGLFVNGVARWGFASILETSASLRSDGAFGSLTPSFNASAMIGPSVANISFTWALPPTSAALDGVSILVNDVERHRSFFVDHRSSEDSFTWSRAADMSLPEYFRFGYVKDGVALDYSGAGTWHSNGTWDIGTAL